MIPRHATWVRFPRYIGDAVMQFSILRLLRPVVETPLVVWGPRLTVSLVEGTDLADAVLPDIGKPNAWQLRRILQEHHAARSVHFPKSLRPALAAFLARVPERIGVSESLAGLFNTHTAPFWKAEGSCIERYRRILLQRWPDLPAAPFPDYQSPLHVEILKEPYICLMPGASTKAKTWETAHFAGLAEIITKQGYRPVVLGSTSEKSLGDSVGGTQGLNLCGDTLVQAAAWLRGAAGAVGNDSGLSHLAAACGTPVLSLYGATEPGMFAPHGPKARTMRLDGVPCAPCNRDRCFVPGHPCLSGLAPEAVWQRLETMLHS